MAISFQDVLAAIQQGDPYYRTIDSTNGTDLSGGMQGPTTAQVPGAYTMNDDARSVVYRNPEDGSYVVSSPVDGGVRQMVFDANGNVTYDRFNPDVGNMARRSAIGAVTTLGGAALGANVFGPMLAGAGAGAGAGGGLAANAAIDSSLGGAYTAAGVGSGLTAPAAAGGAATMGATMGADGVIYPTAAEAAAASAAAAPAASAPGASYNDAIDQSLGEAARQAGVQIPADLGGFKSVADWVRSNASWLLPVVGAGAALADNKPITTHSNSSSTTNGTQSMLSSGTTTQNSQSHSSTGLADWQMPFATGQLQRVNDLANRPAPVYGGQFTAGTTADQQTSYDLIRKLATQGDPTVNAGASYVRDVLGGKYLNSNPYIDTVAKGVGTRMGDAYATGTRAGLFSAFNNDGNSVANKSGGAQSMFTSDRAFGDSLGQTMANLYYGNYRDERNAQGQAANLAPTYGNWNMNAAQQLNNVGTQQQQTAQNDLTARYADWLRQQEYPFRTAALMNQTINPAWGSQSNTNSSSVGTSQQNSYGTTNSTTNGSNSSTIDAPSSWQALLAGAIGGTGIYRNIFK